MTAKVLHDCDCAVWTSVHIENALPAEPTCRKIACAVDLGPRTKDVLLWASGMALRMGAQLLVLHVTAPADPLIADASESDAGVRAIEAARETLQKVLQEMNVDAEIVVDSGSISEGIYRRVAQFAADLLVLGRHAQTGIAARLHPHAYSIIRESPCPVVSI